MKIYIGNCGHRNRQQIIKEHPLLGQLLTADYIGSRCECSFVYDNGAYSAYVNKRPFNGAKFVEGLGKVEKYKDYCDFAVIPDIVAGGLESLNFSIDWIDSLPINLNWYLPVQDRMVPNCIPKFMLSEIKGIFVGGTDTWKYRTAQIWVDFAHRQNLKCHIGKVGTERKVLWAKNINADSIDSSNFAQNKIHWNQLMDLLKHEQHTLK